MTCQDSLLQPYQHARTWWVSMARQDGVTSRVSLTVIERPPFRPCILSLCAPSRVYVITANERADAACWCSGRRIVLHANHSEASDLGLGDVATTDGRT